MKRSRFCAKEFANAQAVRAHLKGCDAYRQTKIARETPGTRQSSDVPGNAASVAGSASRRENGGPEAFDPVKQLEKQVAASRLRLQLREVDDAHTEMDRRRHEQEQERQRKADQEEQARLAREQEEEAAHWREERARRERVERENAERQRRQERRAILQDIKLTVADEWTAESFGLPEFSAASPCGESCGGFRRSTRSWPIRPISAITTSIFGIPRPAGPNPKPNGSQWTCPRSSSRTSSSGSRNAVSVPIPR